MWSIIEPINLIRYLIAWRVTSDLVVLPDPFSPVLSRLLGAAIAERLPTRKAQEWHDTVAAWGENNDNPSVEAQWPMEAVLFPYPAKRHYGEGEVIFWELKLMGPSADHGLFLEFILPAMEDVATMTDPRWHRSNWLWGNFAIQAVYAARGRHWEPVVSEGQLDLDYRATPAQWAEELPFGQDARGNRHHLTWLMPFDLGEMPDVGDNSYRAEEKIGIAVREVPTLTGIIKAMVERMALFMPEKRPTVKDVLHFLEEQDEREKLEQALKKGQWASRKQKIALTSTSREQAGRWSGEQHFARPIPRQTLPYLELASILHVGEMTHFGCGTFELS